MTHQEHIHLIKKAFTQNGGVWADLGSGDGAFTFVLADVLGREAKIYSVDKDEKRLTSQKNDFKKKFPDAHVTFIEEDFTKPLALPFLDGIVMANSLHYIEDQKKFLTRLRKYLKPSGKIVFVEYNIDKGNQWVPYPLSFTTLKNLLDQTDFRDVKLLEKIPSSYWDEMYSAEAIVS